MQSLPSFLPSLYQTLRLYVRLQETRHHSLDCCILLLVAQSLQTVGPLPSDVFQTLVCSPTQDTRTLNVFTARMKSLLGGNGKTSTWARTPAAQ
jgi:hypothetical protein